LGQQRPAGVACAAKGLRISIFGLRYSPTPLPARHKAAPNNSQAPQRAAGEKLSPSMLRMRYTGSACRAVSNKGYFMKSKLFLLFSVLLLCFLPIVPAHERPPGLQPLISWLLDHPGEFSKVPFAEVIHATTGKRILPLDLTQAADQEILSRIHRALDEVLLQMNQPDSPVRREKRINEVSAHFEHALKERLNAVPELICDFPKNASGKYQRSGYPDLRIEDRRSGRVIYLDPKIYAAQNRASTLRTFYFEPKRETNKVLEDAHHLLAGFEHDGRTGEWSFLRWELIDLSRFNVRLKAEFQASNRDLYRPDAIVASSGR
jgi:hypothetical protein